MARARSRRSAPALLTGVSTYSGPTTVSGGALVVTGSIANSVLTVGSGTTLTSTGTLGATTIASGGTFAPGPTGTPGSMTVNGNLAFQSGAIYVVQVNPAAASSANVSAGRRRSRAPCRRRSHRAVILRATIPSSRLPAGSTAPRSTR